LQPKAKPAGVHAMGRLETAGKDPFAEMNEAQRAAVDHGAGPLLVIAGAGSGKTKTLSARVARLIRDGADPSRILLLTFSRRAASDMVRRVGATAAAVAGVSADMHLPWAGTFHAIGARLAARHCAAISLSADFSIHDRGDSVDLMASCVTISVTRTQPNASPRSRHVLRSIRGAVNAEEDLGGVLANAFPWCRAWKRS